MSQHNLVNLKLSNWKINNADYSLEAEMLFQARVQVGLSLSQWLLLLVIKSNEINASYGGVGFFWPLYIWFIASEPAAFLIQTNITHAPFLVPTLVAIKSY